MDRNELDKRASAIAMDTMSRCEKELGLDPQNRDGVVFIAKFGPGQVNLLTGDMISLSRMFFELMREGDCEFADIIGASFLLYLQHCVDPDRRLFYVKRIIDMDIEQAEKESGTPRVKVLGIEHMPEELKKIIGEGLSKEFEGFMKPSKDDVKPSEN